MEYIIGIVVSVIVQIIKRVMKQSVLGTYLALLLISFSAAAIYVFVKDTAIWPLFMQIVTVAGAFYAFVIRRFENIPPLFTPEELER